LRIPKSAAEICHVLVCDVALSGSIFTLCSSKGTPLHSCRHRKFNARLSHTCRSCSRIARAPFAGKKEQLALEFQKLRLHRGFILHFHFSTHLGIHVTLQGKSHSMLSSCSFVMLFYLGRVSVYWHAPEGQHSHSDLYLSVIPRMSPVSSCQSHRLVVAAQVW
jgi:hypothetical protein